MFIGHFAPALVAATRPKSAGLGTLFVAAKLCKASIGGMSIHIMPLMAMNVAVLFLTTYVPWLSKALPKFLFGIG